MGGIPPFQTKMICNLTLTIMGGRIQNSFYKFFHNSEKEFIKDSDPDPNI